jgi:hypothetical protein
VVAHVVAVSDSKQHGTSRTVLELVQLPRRMHHDEPGTTSVTESGVRIIPPPVKQK